ncbi:MAG TPA: restriction endonuclease subunit S [Candidatus Nanoarchaeia archaeon]|nr:restriction endonuclease subunit S [Candidatus Nanoarchaeia archaeon]
MKHQTKFKQTEIGMIPEDWEVKRIGDEIELCYGKGLPETKRIKGKIPVYGSNGIVGFHNESLINGQGIIIGRKGSVGEIKFSGNDFWAIDTTYYVKLLKKGDIKFWYYFLLTLKIDKMNSHSAVPGLNRDNVYKIIEKIPDFEEQQKISKILSDLDSKIELNQQMNKTLEAIGQAIFKHWFVDFDFPNEKGEPYKSSGGEMVESELGEIPKRWKVGKLGDCVEFAYGKGLPETKRQEGHYPVFGSNGIIGFHSEYFVKGPGIVIGRKGTLGEVYWVKDDFFPIDTTFYIIDKLGIGALYFYYYLLKGKEFLKSSSDSAVPGLNRNTAYSNVIIIPPIGIISIFNSICCELFNKNDIILNQSIILSEIRDSLLPRLMSGKIRVPVEVKA